jgi:hypothetical protein
MAISKPRNRVVLFRLTQEEFVKVQAACTRTGARSVSDYARARILGQPGMYPAVDEEPEEATAVDTGQIEVQLADLARSVEHLTRLVEAVAPPRADAASAR